MFIFILSKNIMKHLFLFFSLSILYVSQAAGQVTASFTASATIIEPVGITTTAEMNFANLDAENGGAVILTPENTRISEGGVTLAEGGVISAASFEVTGQKGYTYAITLPEGDYILQNGSAEMVINNFTTNLQGENILADNSQTFRVGATLNVQPNQQPGLYSSVNALIVAVNYN